jgi:hypothetical protein
MSYLYGDSSPSPLKVNFLELLRRALDFSVHVLLSAERQKKDEARLRELERAADSTLVRLEALSEVSKHAVEGYTKDLTDEHVKTCGGRIIRSIDDCVRRETDEIQQHLEHERAMVDQRSREEHASCQDALGIMLAHADLPDTTTKLHLEAAEGGRYGGTLSGRDTLGLAWTMEIELPENNAFSQIALVERFVPQLEVHAPAIGGWLKKELKVRSIHLERMQIREVTVEPGVVRIKLRDPTIVPIPGYDVEIRDLNVTMKWTGEGASNEDEPFVPNDDDTTKLLELRDAIVKSTNALARKRGRLLEATWKDVPFHEHRDQTAIVGALIHMMAPVVNEISRHSLQPTELVLRRLLGDDRREELFVSKSSLIDKLAPLPPHARALFDPLGLEAAWRHPSIEPGTIPGIPAAALAAPAIASSPPQPEEAPHSAMPSAQPGARRSDKPSPPPPPASDVLLSARESGSQPAGAVKAAGPLVQQIKRIIALAKSGKADEAYLGYAELFRSQMFAECRIEDQRNALKLLVMPKTAPAARTEALVEAHRAALGAIKILVDASGDPADYELLGVCQMTLEDKDAASATFKAALAIEKERHPESPLADTLAKRAASI